MLEVIDEEKLDLYSKTRLATMPPVTDVQADYMLHAIGADYRPPRRYKGKLFYHAYRNYYGVGNDTRRNWDDLVKKGYAAKDGDIYSVTPDGLSLLELMTGSTIYDDYDNYADCRTAVLDQFLRHSVSCAYGCWIPISATTVAQCLHMPLPLVREACRNLVSEGYLVRDHYGEMDDDGRVFCYHGYSVTQKGRELDRWKVLNDEEIAYINKMLDVKEE